MFNFGVLPVHLIQTDKPKYMLQFVISVKDHR